MIAIAPGIVETLKSLEYEVRHTILIKFIFENIYPGFYIAILNHL